MDVLVSIRHMRAASKLPLGSIGEEDRKALLQACQELRASLENPIEVGMRIVFSVGFIST